MSIVKWISFVPLQTVEHLNIFERRRQCNTPVRFDLTLVQSSCPREMNEQSFEEENRTNDQKRVKERST